MKRFGTTVTEFGPYQRVAAAIALVAGALTLVGVATGNDVLTRWIASSTTMNPVTAILLVTASLTILFPFSNQRGAMLAASVAMIAAGAVKLIQVALGRPLGIDYVVSSAISSHASIFPDPVALNTAVALVLLGGALAIGRTTLARHAIAAQALAIVAIAITLMALVGFALGAATINQLTFNRMAVNSAVGLAALGMAIMGLTRQHGLRDCSSIVARRESWREWPCRSASRSRFCSELPGCGWKGHSGLAPAMGWRS